MNVLTVILRAYVAETSMDHLAALLKKGGIKDLLIFFPPNRRTDAVLDAHFRGAGLPQVADWWTRKQNAVIKEEIVKAIKESLGRDDQPSDVRLFFLIQFSCCCFFPFFFFFSFPFPFVFGLLKRRGNRSSLLCTPLSRSVRSPRPNLSRASGRALWLRLTGARARIRSRALLYAKSRCVSLLYINQHLTVDHNVALRAYHRAILPWAQGRGRPHQRRAGVLLRGHADHEGVPADLEGSSTSSYMRAT